MEREDILKTVYSKIDELPTLPAVIPRLLSLIEEDKSDISDVINIISHDPALTSKLLKVANSAYYGFPQRVSDLERAVALMGFNMVKSLALSIGIMHTIPSSQKSTSFSQKDLWLHSVSVASVLNEIGKIHGSNKGNEHLFTTGLLHDIGILILEQFFRELFQDAFNKTIRMEIKELYLAEKEVIGIDHGEVGAMLLSRWRFPQEILIPIKYHHFDRFPKDEYIRDVIMLRMADALCHEVKLKNSNDLIAGNIREEDLEVLNIDEEDLKYIRDFLIKSKEDINAFFNAIT